MNTPVKASGAGYSGKPLPSKLGLATGLVDVKVCAVDATWSGLKFVRRLRDRRG